MKRITGGDNPNVKAAASFPLLWPAETKDFCFSHTRTDGRYHKSALSFLSFVSLSLSPSS